MGDEKGEAGGVISTLSAAFSKFGWEGSFWAGMIVNQPSSHQLFFLPSDFKERQLSPEVSFPSLLVCWQLDSEYSYVNVGCEPTEASDYKPSFLYSILFKNLFNCN